MTFDFFETKKMLSVCLCLCLEHTVLDGILEKHQCHWHQSWTLVVVLELCLHESLEVGQITEIFVHPELIQEITCKSIKTMNNMKKNSPTPFHHNWQASYQISVAACWGRCHGK